MVYRTLGIIGTLRSRLGCSGHFRILGQLTVECTRVWGVAGVWGRNRLGCTRQWRPSWWRLVWTGVRVSCGSSVSSSSDAWLAARWQGSFWWCCSRESCCGGVEVVVVVNRLFWWLVCWGGGGCGLGGVVALVCGAVKGLNKWTQLAEY